MFCPNEAPGLPDVFGDEFEALYASYEAKGLARRSIKARQLWVAIMDAQVSELKILERAFNLSPAVCMFGGCVCIYLSCI